MRSIAASASWISVRIAAWEAVRHSMRESGMSVKHDISGVDDLDEGGRELCGEDAGLYDVGEGLVGDDGERGGVEGCGTLVMMLGSDMVSTFVLFVSWSDFQRATTT